MIYFVQAVGGGPIKIGVTDNLDVRLKGLRTTYGRPLVVLATMEGGAEEERAIHKRFAHLQFSGKEQFRPALELLAFIGKEHLAVPNPETVEEMRHPLASVSIDPDVVRKAKYVASCKGKSVSEWLTETLAPIVEREFRKEVGDGV